MLMILVLLVIAGFAVHVMSPAERTRVLQRGLKLLFVSKDAVVKYQQGRDPFQDVLATRTRWVVVTPAIAALNIVIFAGMLFGEGPLSDPKTLIGWGASIGPHTTNGEWWRLLASAFVHAGMLQLVINTAALVQVGLILERLVGHLAFATVYVAAALLASLVNLSANPMAVSAGASGAVFGLYGLLFASLIWGMLPRSDMTMPLATLKRLGPAAAVFVLYNVFNTGLESGAEFTGLAVGSIGGLFLARHVSSRKPGTRDLAIATIVAVGVAIAYAIPLRGVADVRPEIQRVIATEDRTSRAYEAAVKQFRLGAIKAEALAQVIDRSIVPELRAARARLNALTGVPVEHQPLVAATEEYLKLRDESWRLRAEALSTHSMPALQRADGAERASLSAFEKIKATELQ